MDVRLRELAARQADIVAAWQLRAIGLTDHMIKHHRRHDGWRVVHEGVYALTQAPLIRHQRWVAATLTTPDAVLSHASAAACWGFRPWEGSFETISRPGSGGRHRVGTLLVCRSLTLSGETTRRGGIPITTAARTLIDIASSLDTRATGKSFREAVRLRTTTVQRIAAALARHRGRRGTAGLRELVSRYATIPYARTRSDAEARALELLHDAGVERPLVNVRIGGEEADLAWPRRWLIVEIDGPQYHLFREEDARKERCWEGAGYKVRRIPSGAVFDDPARLLALAPRG